MRLRTIRIILQTAVFAGFITLFVLSLAIPPIVQELSYLQFVPAMARTVEGTSFVPLIVLGAILAGTILLGRVYCGILCPLGTAQDGLFFLTRKKKRLMMSFRQSRPWIRLPVVAAVVIFLVFGSSLLFSLLDPFGVFGRTTALAVNPLLLLGGSLGSSFLELFGIYPMVQLKLPVFVPLVFIISAALFGTAAVLSLLRGRLYCNTVCPVGTILGWFSSVSFLKIGIKKDLCTSCMRCARQCRSSCIDISRHEIDRQRCTSCFDCIAACPEGAVQYGRNVRGDARVLAEGPADPSRRAFITRLSLAAGTITATAAALAFSPVSVSALVPSPEEGPTTPPGSRGYSHLASLCTSCYACVSVCPTRVIRPSFLEYGTPGMFKPVLDYSHGFCEYGCTKCLEVCPSGAILPVSLTEKKRIQIGLSVLDIEKCVVKLNKEDCGACAEACPTRAVVMVLYEDGLFYPETRNDYCIGCGACEYACPARPLAITVTGKRVHEKAAIVQADTLHGENVTELIPVDDSEEEFPF